jgi:hypothetical protein
MRRREFLSLIAGLGIWPLAARAAEFNARGWLSPLSEARFAARRRMSARTERHKDWHYAMGFCMPPKIGALVQRLG